MLRFIIFSNKLYMESEKRPLKCKINKKMPDFIIFDHKGSKKSVWLVQ